LLPFPSNLYKIVTVYWQLTLNSDGLMALNSHGLRATDTKLLRFTGNRQ